MALNDLPAALAQLGSLITVFHSELCIRLLILWQKCLDPFMTVLSRKSTAMKRTPSAEATAGTVRQLRRATSVQIGVPEIDEQSSSSGLTFPKYVSSLVFQMRKVRLKSRCIACKKTMAAYADCAQGRWCARDCSSGRHAGGQRGNHHGSFHI